MRFIGGEQSALIRLFSKRNNLSIRSTAKFLDVGETSLKKWIKEERTLPSNVFSAICRKTPELIIYKAKIKERLPANWGRIKGGNSRIRNIENLNAYLERVRSIKNKKRLIRTASLKKNIIIRNDLLSNLLKDNIDLKFILATCLLTDGSLTVDGNSYRISYYTKDEVLRNFMKALLFELSRFIPSENYSKKGVYGIRVNDYHLAKNLLKLSPSYKTNPRTGQAKENYLCEPQPSLRFMNEAGEKTLKWCIRFAFSTDGCISVSKNNSVELNLACQHPNLSLEWMGIFKRYGIIGNLGKKSDTWSGISGIRIYNLDSLRNFTLLGGFVPKVKITGKSKRYKGLEKNTLLKRAMRARSFLAH